MKIATAPAGAKRRARSVYTRKLFDMADAKVIANERNLARPPRAAQDGMLAAGD